MKRISYIFPLRYFEKILLTLFEFTALFILQKLLFACVYSGSIKADAMTLLAASVWHGLSLDFSVAAYLTAVPLVLTAAGIWWRPKIMTVVERIYFGVVALVLAMIFVLDIVLYSYWGFRLDMTPLFYFFSSPSSAMASVKLSTVIAGLTVVVLLARILYKLFNRTLVGFRLHDLKDRRTKIITASGMLIAGGILFLIMRGGVTVSTMNLSRAYFSNDAKLNHVAVNPAFSLLFSAMRQHDFGSQFNYFSDSEAEKTVGRMLRSVPAVRRDTLVTLNVDKPDIYLVILESFSSHLMPSLGGSPVAMKIDSIAAEGVSWKNAYATGFRTDRGIPAILSAFPTQPTISVMKYVEKSEHLPSLATELTKGKGYSASYYYGGDANFTNMLAYLVSQGYEKIVSDKDFPISRKASKWGAHDDVLFDKVLEDISSSADERPRFMVIQTSSSHEPFEVPYSNPRFRDNPRLNAFAYTDSCVASFIKRVESTERGKNSLFILVPDHYGAWPMRDSLPSMPSRHHIPLIFAGKALSHGGIVNDRVASQTDIAATLLGLLGLDHSKFRFSRDLLDLDSPESAWIAEPDMVGIINEKGYLIYNIESSAIVESKGDDVAGTETEVMSYLQYLYDVIEHLGYK